jgi:hypothetical protein
MLIPPQRPLERNARVFDASDFLQSIPTRRHAALGGGAHSRRRLPNDWCSAASARASVARKGDRQVQRPSWTASSSTASRTARRMSCAR